MATLTSIATLEEKYIQSCKKHGIVPNSTILSAFSEAEAKKSLDQRCIMYLSVDNLKYDDLHPFLKLSNEINTSEIEGIDLFVRSSCSLEDHFTLCLIHSLNRKLRVLHLHDSFGTSFWREIFFEGLSCKVLNVKYLHFRKLNIVGSFENLHTLILDNNRVIGFGEGCFSSMPKLTYLSMCDSLVSDLWTTTAALSKLSSLNELRFQIWISCSDSTAPPTDDNLPYEIPEKEDDSDPSIAVSTELNYISSKASPICLKNHYRMYMINSLPTLKVLDNLAIRKSDRDKANETYTANFEHLPYKRKKKENIFHVLKRREISSSKENSQRSLCAARMGLSAWPRLDSLSLSKIRRDDEDRRLCPRQFEYHPLDPSLMVYGTVDGEVVVINHENGKIVGYVPSNGSQSSILGLCWLKMYPSLVIAGSANGSLKLYDTKKALTTVTTTSCHSGSVTFDMFDQLTSVHVNSTDNLFLSSGYSKDVALYDIDSGTRLNVFANMHQEHINVVKFSNHSPSIFATSSFDKDVKLWDLRQEMSRPCYTVSSNKGNVMVCFSPNDRYLLTSAVDNEVRQLMTADGRVHLNFEIVPRGSSMNYTRSYYMNGNDYIISGSCDENVVRVCCAQTGRRLRDVTLQNGTGYSMMFVQSLRGDPFRDFNMSILAAYTRPSSVSKIVKVNLLASRDCVEEKSHNVRCYPSNGMGG